LTIYAILQMILFTVRDALW